MSIYTQQVNNIMERLPESEQQFVLEFVKKISVSDTANTNETLNKPIPLKKAINRFIEGLNAITDEPLDEEFDEIVRNRINITRELDL